MPDREERIVKAVLDDEFREAAEAYADELMGNLRSLEVVSLRRLMQKREQFINARRMQLAQ